MGKKGHRFARLATIVSLALVCDAIAPAAWAAPSAPEILSPHQGQALSGVPVWATGMSDGSVLISIFEGSVQIGGGLAEPDGLWSFALDIGGGSHTIRAFALGGDLSQSPPSASVTFTVNAPPIAPRFTSPVQDTRTNQPSVTLAGNTDNGTTVTLKEGTTTLATGVPVSDRQFSKTLPFSAGTHTVTATATDGQGRTSSAGSVRFTVDLTPPAAPSISSPSQGAGFPAPNVTVSGSTEPNARVRVYRGTAELGNTTANGSGGWSIPLSGLAAGSHTITAVATDVAGNTGPASAGRTFVIDMTPPETSFTTANNSVFTSPASITGSSTDNYRVARTQLRYRTVAGTEVRAVNSAACTGCGTASATWSDAPGLATGVYAVTATAYDTAGNPSGSVTLTYVQV